MKCKRIFALMIAGLFALSGCGENRTVSEQLSETSQTSQISTEISDCFSNPFDGEVGQKIRNKMAEEAEKTDHKISMTVWYYDENKDCLEEAVKKFEEKFDSEEFEFDIEIKKSHSGKFLESPKDSADVFFFPSEQIADFKENISPVIAMFQNNIIRENMENAVSCAMIDSKLYGFPKSPDSHNVLFYDKRVLSEDDVQSLETIIEKSAQQGKNVLFNLENDFYCADMFLTAGVEMSCSDGKMSANFTSQEGLNSAKAICELVKHNGNGIITITLNNGESVYSNPFASGDVSAQIATVSQHDEILRVLGEENFGVAKLPTVKIDGKDVQMKSLDGYTLCGVNANTKYPVTAQVLAYYITNPEAQLKEYTSAGTLPTSIYVTEENEKNVIISALKQQSEYAEVYQEKINSDYYSAGISDFVKKIEELSGDVSDTQLNEMLAEIQTYF